MSVMRRAFALILITTGCVIPEPSVETTDQALVIEDGCAPKECGSNSSVINGVYFYELSDQIGIANTEGVTVLGYQNLPPGATRLDARKNELVAKNALGTVVATGADLVGSRYILDVAGQVVLLEVRDFHRTLQYWAANDGTQLSSYTFAYPVVEGSSTVWKPLCTVQDLGDGIAALDAFVFEGDRFDPVTKQVTTGAVTKGWYNLGCMGGAPAKNFRMRATTASSAPLAPKPITTTLDQRQSLFNLWTANYCGDGTPFTVPGEPLRVRDGKQWIPTSSAWSWEKESQLDSYEAVWGPDGAVCLELPRRDDTAHGYRDVIEKHCDHVGHELPLCSTLAVFPDHWQASGAYASANPTGS
jgi:hypothetical protein